MSWSPFIHRLWIRQKDDQECNTNMYNSCRYKKHPKNCEYRTPPITVYCGGNVLIWATDGHKLKILNYRTMTMTCTEWWLPSLQHWAVHPGCWIDKYCIYNITTNVETAALSKKTYDTAQVTFWQWWASLWRKDLANPLHHSRWGLQAEEIIL